MAKVKKLLLILLTLSLVFAIAACGGKNTPCDTCVDADDDGKCDKISTEEEEILNVKKDIADILYNNDIFEQKSYYYFY